MSLITSLQHAVASAFHDIKVAATYTEQTILPALKAVNANKGMIDAVANASNMPFVQQAARVEESLVGWAIDFIETSEAAGKNPADTLGTLVNDVKSLAPTLKNAAQAVISTLPPKA